MRSRRVASATGTTAKISSDDRREGHDLRDDLKRFLRGERKRASGGHISVQFLVRGHWKNQVHGPGRSLRKRIWIKPFWKGDEEARVLLRNYEIKGEEPQA